MIDKPIAIKFNKLELKFLNLFVNICGISINLFSANFCKKWLCDVHCQIPCYCCYVIMWKTIFAATTITTFVETKKQKKIRFWDKICGQAPHNNVLYLQLVLVVTVLILNNDDYLSTSFEDLILTKNAGKIVCIVWKIFWTVVITGHLKKDRWTFVYLIFVF